MDAGPRPTNAEVAQLVAMLKDAGLVQVYTDEQGREAYRLTEEGVRVGHTLALVVGEDAEALLHEPLLTEGPGDEPGRSCHARDNGPQGG